MQNRPNKLTPTSRRLIFLGLEPGAWAARLWDKTTHRIIVNGDVQYQEDIFPAQQQDSTTSTAPSLTCHSFPPELESTNETPIKIPTLNTTNVEPPNTHNSTEPATPPPPTPEPEALSSSHDGSTVTMIPPTPPAPPAPRRSTREVTQTRFYGHNTALSATDHNHPTYHNAMKGPDKQAWMAAMSEEFDSLLQHNVGTLVDPPADVNILGGMWVFAKKRDEFNCVVWYKARWVVFGNHQIEGVDFKDTYASVGKVDSLRILIALAVSKKLLIRQFDIKTAFLNGDMKDAVYC